MPGFIERSCGLLTTGRFLGSADTRVSTDHYDINIETDQLGGEIGIPFAFVFGAAK